MGSYAAVVWFVALFAASQIISAEKVLFSGQQLANFMSPAENVVMTCEGPGTVALLHSTVGGVSVAVASDCRIELDTVTIAASTINLTDSSTDLRNVTIIFRTLVFDGPLPSNGPFQTSSGFLANCTTCHLEVQRLSASSPRSAMFARGHFNDIFRNSSSCTVTVSDVGNATFPLRDAYQSVGVLSANCEISATNVYASSRLLYNALQNATLPRIVLSNITAVAAHDIFEPDWCLSRIMYYTVRPVLIVNLLHVDPLIDRVLHSACAYSRAPYVAIDGVYPLRRMDASNLIYCLLGTALESTDAVLTFTNVHGMAGTAMDTCVGARNCAATVRHVSNCSDCFSSFASMRTNVIPVNCSLDAANITRHQQQLPVSRIHEPRRHSRFP
jgi:hypothetical protein